MSYCPFSKIESQYNRLYCGTQQAEQARRPGRARKGGGGGGQGVTPPGTVLSRPKRIHKLIGTITKDYYLNPQ